MAEIFNRRVDEIHRPPLNDFLGCFAHYKFIVQVAEFDYLLDTIIYMKIRLGVAQVWYLVISIVHAEGHSTSFRSWPRRRGVDRVVVSTW